MQLYFPTTRRCTMTERDRSYVFCVLVNIRKHIEICMSYHNYIGDSRWLNFRERCFMLSWYCCNGVLAFILWPSFPNFFSDDFKVPVLSLSERNSTVCLINKPIGQEHGLADSEIWYQQYDESSLHVHVFLIFPTQSTLLTLTVIFSGIMFADT